jgi:hypothetical protein
LKNTINYNRKVKYDLGVKKNRRCTLSVCRKLYLKKLYFTERHSRRPKKMERHPKSVTGSLNIKKISIFLKLDFGFNIIPRKVCGT